METTVFRKVKAFDRRGSISFTRWGCFNFYATSRRFSKAALKVIDEKLPFVIETDASENAISATLNHQNRPVAYFLKMLNKHELKHSNIKKEAAAIVEAVRK